MSRNRPSRSFRPAVEVLEDRTVPSGSPLDAPAGYSKMLLTLLPALNGWNVTREFVLSDGEVLVAGDAFGTPGGALFGHAEFGLARFRADGNLDTSFGNGGWVTTDVDGVGGGGGIRALISESVSDVLVQPDGKIVVVGSVSVIETPAPEPPGYFVPEWIALQHFVAAVRYNSDGSLDTTFGANGEAVGPASGDPAEAALAPDGSILMLVNSDGFGSYGTEYLMRDTPDGRFDTTFGASGFAVVRAGADLTAPPPPHALAVQADGKILVAGAWQGDGGLAVERFNADGSVDTGFGTGETIVTPLLGRGSGGVAVAGDKVLVVGLVDGADLGLLRLNADGSPDTGFGDAGSVVTNEGPGMGYVDFAERADGAVVVEIGPGDPGSPFTTYPVVAYNPDGSLNANFGSGGTVVLGSRGLVGGAALAFSADGDVFAFGTLASGQAVELRFLWDAPPSPPDPGGDPPRAASATSPALPNGITASLLEALALPSGPAPPTVAVSPAAAGTSIGAGAAFLNAGPAAPQPGTGPAELGPGRQAASAGADPGDPIAVQTSDPASVPTALDRDEPVQTKS